MVQVTQWTDRQRPGQVTDSSAFPRVTSHQAGHDHPWTVPTWSPCAFKGWCHHSALSGDICFVVAVLCALSTMLTLEPEAQLLSKACRVISDP